MTTEANPTLGKIENIFKNLVWDNLITVGITAFFSYAPFLAVWPLKPLITFILTKFADQIFAVVKLNIDLAAIELLNAEHKKEFTLAAIKLKSLEKDKGLNSVEYKTAREEAKLALSKFVMFGDAKS